MLFLEGSSGSGSGPGSRTEVEVRVQVWVAVCFFWRGGGSGSGSGGARYASMCTSWDIIPLAGFRTKLSDLVVKRIHSVFLFTAQIHRFGLALVVLVGTSSAQLRSTIARQAKENKILALNPKPCLLATGAHQESNALNCWKKHKLPPVWCGHMYKEVVGLLASAGKSESSPASFRLATSWAASEAVIHS